MRSRLEQFSRALVMPPPYEEPNQPPNPTDSAAGAFMPAPPCSTSVCFKERRSNVPGVAGEDGGGAYVHGGSMSGAFARFIAGSWASANTFRRSLDLNLMSMPEGASAEPRGYVPGSLRDGLR